MRRPRHAMQPGPAPSSPLPAPEPDIDPMNAPSPPSAPETMTHTVVPPLALHGWYILTQFVDLAPAFEGEDAGARSRRLERVAELLSGWDDLGENGWSGLYRLVGGQSEYMLLHFRPTLEALGEAERTLRLRDEGRDLILTGDYVSVVELGLYAHTHALMEKAAHEGIAYKSEAWDEMVDAFLAEQHEKAYTRRRLYPRQPDEMPYVCFYPTGAPGAATPGRSPRSSPAPWAWTTGSGR